MQKILVFKPIYKEKIWGGNKLHTLLHRDLPRDDIGESWDIADYETDTSEILNGALQGMSLHQAISRHRDEIMGRHISGPGYFPLLIKIIDASDILSVQVHPDDSQAVRLEGRGSGKNEFWVVMQSDPGSYLYCGFNRPTSEPEYRALVAEGRTEEILKKFHVRKYDSFLLEPGTIHAIGKGVQLLEIQETADLTYRVYDYNRRDDKGELRDLHLDKAMDVMNFNVTENASVETGTPLHWGAGERMLLAANDKFRVEKLEFTDNIILPSMTVHPAFHIVSVLEGQVAAEDENRVFNKGDSFLVTAMAMEQGFHLKTDRETVIILSTAGSKYQQLVS